MNGYWEYSISAAAEKPAEFDGHILVPFSPEAELSSVNRILMPNETLWYRRLISIPEGFFIGRLLLHFGAVDQIAAVYLNGEFAGKHVGGFLPFTIDLTALWKSGQENVLVVRVQDGTDTSWHTRGKQKIKRGGIWYTPQSGIWQTVWMESVPADYIQGLRICPDFDASQVEITVQAEAAFPCEVEGAGSTVSGVTNQPLILKLDAFEAWTPETPTLYPITVRMGQDQAQSYFGMRKFSVETDSEGVPRFYLNNQPIFQSGLLDQGYYSDGMLTAPADEALIADIQLAKEMGFNMLRKHIKVEPLRWYYHCDRLGMLVWQDMPNGGEKYSNLLITMPVVIAPRLRDNRYKLFGRKSQEGREQFLRELDEMLALLHNQTSIAVWVPFNEGWGQFDARQVSDHVRQQDLSRPIDATSGWYDQQCGDFFSSHVYFKKYRFKKDDGQRAVVLSEFGGYNFRIQGHAFNQKDFGYKRFTDQKAFETALKKLYADQIQPAVAQGLAAAIYTQLSDVEDELNGLITYDREVCKLPPAFFREINQALYKQFREESSKGK